MKQPRSALTDGGSGTKITELRYKCPESYVLRFIDCINSTVHIPSKSLLAPLSSDHEIPFISSLGSCSPHKRISNHAIQRFRTRRKSSRVECCSTRSFRRSRRTRVESSRQE